MAQIIPVTLRRNKGSILTHDEMDDNLQYFLDADTALQANIDNTVSKTSTNTQDILDLQNASGPSGPTLPDNIRIKELYIDNEKGERDHNSVYINLNISEEIPESLVANELLGTIYIKGYLSYYMTPNNWNTTDNDHLQTSMVEKIFHLRVGLSEGQPYISVFDGANKSVGTIPYGLNTVHIRRFCSISSNYDSHYTMDGHLTFEIKDMNKSLRMEEIDPECVFISEPH